MKESVEGALDWREQFRSHPVAWLLGALSVGYVVGNSVAASFNDSKYDDHLLSHLASLGEHFADELSDQGMKGRQQPRFRCGFLAERTGCRHQFSYAPPVQVLT